MKLTGFDKMPIFESFWFSSALKEKFYLIINFTINEMESFTNSTLSGKRYLRNYIFRAIVHNDNNLILVWSLLNL